MTQAFTIDKTKTALLVMDYQNLMITNNAKNDPGLLDRATATIAAARRAELPVIYVVVRFRKGYPEASPRNAMHQMMRANGLLQEGTPGAEIHTQVTPQEGDVVVVKRRTNAFFTTDLETILKAQGIDSLILMGISTSGVVLSTVRWASDADYNLYVVADCCADADPEVHQVLTQKVFPRQAHVLESTEIITALDA